MESDDLLTVKKRKAEIEDVLNDIQTKNTDSLEILQDVKKRKLENPNGIDYEEYSAITKPEENVPVASSKNCSTSSLPEIDSRFTSQDMTDTNIETEEEDKNKDLEKKALSIIDSVLNTIYDEQKNATNSLVNKNRDMIDKTIIKKTVEKEEENKNRDINALSLIDSLLDEIDQQEDAEKESQVNKNQNITDETMDKEDKNKIIENDFPGTTQTSTEIINLDSSDDELVSKEGSQSANTDGKHYSTSKCIPVNTNIIEPRKDEKKSVNIKLYKSLSSKDIWITSKESNADIQHFSSGSSSSIPDNIDNSESKNNDDDNSEIISLNSPKDKDEKDNGAEEDAESDIIDSDNDDTDNQNETNSQSGSMDNNVNDDTEFENNANDSSKSTFDDNLDEDSSLDDGSQGSVQRKCLLNTNSSESFECTSDEDSDGLSKDDENKTNDNLKLSEGMDQNADDFSDIMNELSSGEKSDIIQVDSDSEDETDNNVNDDMESQNYDDEIEAMREDNSESDSELIETSKENCQTTAIQNQLIDVICTDTNYDQHEEGFPGTYYELEPVYGVQCSLTNCITKMYDENNLMPTYFQFPNDFVRCSAWIEQCGARNLPILNQQTKCCLYLCSSHFEREMFFSYENKVLYGNALPTLFSSDTTLEPKKSLTIHTKIIKIQMIFDLSIKTINNSLCSSTPEFTGFPEDIQFQKLVSEAITQNDDVNKSVILLQERLKYAGTIEECIQICEELLPPDFLKLVKDYLLDN